MSDTTKIDDGGPAFPRTLLYETEQDALGAVSYHTMAGMTLRDYFAAKAMAALLARGLRCPDGTLRHYNEGIADEEHEDTDRGTLSRDAYAIADAMLEARRD